MKDTENKDQGCIEEISVTAHRCTCNRCSYTWVVFSENIPQTCANPACRSRYWNKKRVKNVK